MSRRMVVPILVVLALAWAPAACSVGDGDAATDAATTPSTEAAPPSEPAAVGSAGCEAEPPSPGRTVETVTSGGQERAYIRYVPEGLEPGTPAPLVLDVPAYSPASTQEGFSGFTVADADGTPKADEVGAVVVTPEPVNGAGALLTWNYVDTEGWTDDQAFVMDLLDDVEAAACIDTERVLALGFAVGGVFASITACDQAARFAALATVAGLYSPEGCAPEEPLPVVSFHGTGDRFVPYDGSVGSGAGGLGLSPETTAGLAFMAGRDGALASSTAWADHDGCAAEPTEEVVTEGLTRMAWSECDADVAVELYTVDGGEHTWPGSPGMGDYEALLGPVSDVVVATDVIWDFFEAHAA